MMDFYTPEQIDVYAYVVGYLLQAIGMAVAAVGVYKRPDVFLKRHFFSAVMILEAAVITAALLSGSAAMLLVLNLAMNILHGAVAACYLAMLSALVPQQYRGRAFGFGYAVGSLGSWLLSIPGGGFLNSRAVILVYLALIALTLFVNLKSEEIRPGAEDVRIGRRFNPRLLILVFAVVMLLSLVKNIGFYFPVADIAGIINLEFSRAFYALGLIAAGFVNDKSRKYGAVCCLMALVFPFISIVLQREAGYAAALWILGYIFLGFFAVYRVTVYADISAERRQLLPLAACGLMAGRVGDVLGAVGGISLAGLTVPLLTVTAGLFILVVFLFFLTYQKLYTPVLNAGGNREALLRIFEKEYALTKREGEVFRLVMQGCSNLEISGALYVSESTVKFHIGNILKKTGCTNRTELTMLFEDHKQPYMA